MHPVLFSIGPVNIFSFGLMLSLGFAAAVLVGFLNAKRHGVDPWTIVDMAIYLFLAGLVGSRLVFVLMNWSLYADDPVSIFATWEGGVSFYGAILGGFVVVVVFSIKRKLSVGRVADAVAPGLAVAAAVGRIGCALNGCCYGLPTSGAWGVFTRFAPGLRHPTQLYESASYFLLFGFLLVWQKKHAKAPGQLFLTFVGGYLIARYIIEFFREGERIYPWLSVTQAASLVIGVVAIAAYVYLGRRARRSLKAAPASGTEAAFASASSAASAADTATAQAEAAADVPAVGPAAATAGEKPSVAPPAAEEKGQGPSVGG